MSQQPGTAKEKIKSAFIKIYKEKAINEITIGNLAAEADVYRGTFYYHYPDIYALLEDVKEDAKANFTQHLIPLLPAFLVSDYSQHHLRPIEEFYEKNEELIRLFLIEKPDIQLLSYAKTALKKLLLETFQLTDREFPQKFHYMLEFTTSGQVALIRKWFQDGRVLTTADFSSAIKVCTGDFVSYLKELRAESAN